MMMLLVVRYRTRGGYPSLIPRALKTDSLVKDSPACCNVIRYSSILREATMGEQVAITRLDLNASDLRCRARRAGSIDAARRMLALALVLEGRPRMEAARTCGMDHQTLRDWVHRYNAEGLRGLSDRKPPGGIPKLKAEQEAEVAAWVRAGPDLAEDGRWRRKDLAARIERRFGVVLARRIKKT